MLKFIKEKSFWILWGDGQAQLEKDFSLEMFAQVLPQMEGIRGDLLCNFVVLRLKRNL